VWQPPPSLPPLSATVLLAAGAAVLLAVLVGLALLRWHRTARWHATIIAALVVATAPVFALFLNALWKAPAEEWRAVTTKPIVSGVTMLIVLAGLAVASKMLGGVYRTTYKDALRAAGGALLMLVAAVASFVLVYCGGFILLGLVAWPGLLLRFSIWPDGYEEIDAFVIMLAVTPMVWFVIFLDFQRSLQHRSAPVNCKPLDAKETS
jgi:hypothetical protein